MWNKTSQIEVSIKTLVAHFNQNVHKLFLKCWLEIVLVFHFLSLDSRSRYSNTKNAFIFSLRNKENLSPFKSVVRHPQYAIHGGSGFGPIFGGWGGHDIYIANNANSNTISFLKFGNSYSAPRGVQNRYTVLVGTTHFTPDDWEVFNLG